jgi:hypothetical protein
LLRLNITNKSSEDELVKTVAELIKGLSTGNAANHQQQQQSAGASNMMVPQLDICVHYSLKYNYDKTPERSLQKLLRFCTDIDHLLQQQQQQQQKLVPAGDSNEPAAGTRCQAIAAGSSSNNSSSSSNGGSGQAPEVTIHVLLVSGGGKKKRLETVSALQGLKQQQQINSSRLQLPSLAVAFNPYLPVEADAVEERRRLRAKLETGLVDKVYLQVGAWQLTQITADRDREVWHSR